MENNIELYKELFKDKKFNEIIRKIEIFEKVKTSQLLHLLGICKLLKNNSTKKDRISAREDFKKVFLEEENSKRGIEALTNFINLNTDFYEIKNSLEYYSNVSEKFSTDYKLLKAISRVYQFSSNINERINILEKILKIDSSSIEDWCSYIYINNFKRSWSQEKFYEVSREFSKKIISIDQKNLKLNLVNKNRKIKIGFFTSDLTRFHSISYFLRGLLRNLNRDKFEINVISNAIKDQNLSDSKIIFDNWYNIREFDDFNAIKFLREKNLDIIFDLMVFTSENRISLFKNKIAPVQISWLGYCNTSGLNEMNYIFTDKNLILDNEEKFYSEKVIKFEKIWNAHEGFKIMRNKVKTPAIENKFITFGSFNNFNKISDQTLKVWSEILKKIKNSKLILKSSTNFILDNFRKKLEYNGILEKIVIIERSDDFNDHLSQYDKIDIALDTFPYNGVTTTFEAIWKGVPVISINGFNFTSRCGSSILKNLGIEDLVAKNEDDYISKAVSFSNDLKTLIRLRDKVYDMALKSPLFDTKSFTLEFEDKIDFILKNELKK